MRILVSGATATLRKLCYRYSDYLGVLMTPQNGNSLCRIPLPWACDNSAFSAPDDRKFWNMAVEAWGMQTFHPPMWVAAPDSVGNHVETRRMFDDWVHQWEYEIGFVPVELAFVLQDGVTVTDVPWDQISAVFVGGSDEFKLTGARELLECATSKGKLKHIGRVNTLNRIRYAMDVGADSIDGTAFSMFPDKKIPRAVEHIKARVNQKVLF